MINFNKISALALALTGAFTTTAAGTVLSNFDNVSDLQKWEVLANSSVKLTLNTDKKFIANGSGSGIFSTPIMGNGESQWPRITFYFGKNKVIRDWSNHHVLKMTVFNPSDEVIKLGLQLRFNGGLRLDYPNKVTLNPGRNDVFWELSDVLIDSTVDSLLVLHSLPQKAYTLYLDDLVLDFDGKVLEKRLQKLEEKFAASAMYNAPEVAKSSAALKRDIANCRKITDLKKRSYEATNCFRRYLKLQNEYFKAVRSNQIAAMKAKQPNAQWYYGWAHALNKIYREEQPFPGIIGSAAELNMARNEGESLLLAVYSDKKAKNVRAVCSDLWSKSGNRISAKSVAVDPVGFVKTYRSIYRVDDNAVWRPDIVMRNLKSIDLDAKVWQPWHLEVSTTEATLPGKYTGTVTFTADNMPDLKVPVTVNVWNFRLADTFPQPSVFSYQADGGAHRLFTKDSKAWKEFSDFMAGKRSFDTLSDEAKRLRAIHLDNERVLRKHHISPVPLYCAHRELKMSDLDRLLAMDINYFNIDYVHPQVVLKGAKYPDAVRKVLLKRLGNVVPELRKRNLMDRALLYSFDEVRENQFAAANDILSEIKRLYPDLTLVTTAMDMDYGKSSGLDRYVDIWVPTVQRYHADQEQYANLRKQGKKVWFYTCCGGRGYMDFLIESPLSGVRMLSGIAQHKYGADGFLYYSATNWTVKRMVDSGPLTQHSGRSYLSYNGCGLLLYPASGMVLPSLRLKAVRDGMEDFEYLRMLKELKAANSITDVTDLAAAERLIKIEDAVMTDIFKYDQQGGNLQKMRLEVGALLSKYADKLPAESGKLKIRP